MSGRSEGARPGIDKARYHALGQVAEHRPRKVLRLAVQRHRSHTTTRPVASRRPRHGSGAGAKLSKVNAWVGLSSKGNKGSKATVYHSPVAPSHVWAGDVHVDAPGRRLVREAKGDSPAVRAHVHLTQHGVRYCLASEPERLLAYSDE